MSETETVYCFLEIQGLHDGWSVAVQRDGTLVNRWQPSSPRYAPTQDWINRFTAYRDALYQANSALGDAGQLLNDIGVWQGSALGHQS